MLQIRAARDDEGWILAEIEQACFNDRRWLASDFAGRSTLLAEVDGKAVGFLVLQDIFGGAGTEPREREVLNLAVLPGYRRQGIARALLEAEMQHAAVYYLEVRESNEIARRLYETFGFVEIARRKHYYRAPEETAIVMRARAGAHSPEGGRILPKGTA